MKMNVPLVVALAMVPHSMAGGFTLDAVGYDGGGLSANPVSVVVAGYGELVFEAAAESALVVGSAYQNERCMEFPELSFDVGDAVGVVVEGLEWLDSGIATVPLAAAGGTLEMGVGLPAPQSQLVTFHGVDGGGEVETIENEPVPEPAAALIGIIGGLLLILRRLR